MDDPTPLPPMAEWKTLLDERMAKHVEYAIAYSRDFNHGAPGHLDLVTIATLAALLERYTPYGERAG